ncbi:hypothetical protein [Geomobilimonas luticola]|uniref:Uncharacterized protein n=1 Tax=Geomobilimonas luticola TaxID=1114878 RepID=A0ABS5SD07_9BACT|nr:hypothetical protein [Geomobilimonas luticola]MBT0652502.1 hypothetical protein [Geomobilimonas luticola]
MKKFNSMGATTILVFCTLMVVSTAPASAVDLEALNTPISIHGFGHQGYLMPTGNKFLGADKQCQFIVDVPAEGITD